METATTPRNGPKLTVVNPDESPEALDLSALNVPARSVEVRFERALTPGALVELRQLTHDFYAELELFIDKFSRAPNELGLNGRRQPNASIAAFDERCTSIIHATYPLALDLPLSQPEAVLKGTAVEFKAIAQDFRFFLRRHSSEGTIGEDQLAVVVDRCIALQHSIAKPIEALDALVFALITGPKKEPRDEKQKKATA